MLKKLFLTVVLFVVNISLVVGMQGPARAFNVVIMGGGMAGLTAAHNLTKMGIQATIVEGRNRLGGRVNTHYFTQDRSSFVEEGGTVIDDDHHDVIALAKEFRVPLRKIGYGTGKVFVYQDGHRVNLNQASHELEALHNYLIDLAHRIQLAIQAPSDQDPFIDRTHQYHSYKPLADFTDRLSPFNRLFLKALCQAEEGVPFFQTPVVHAHGLINDVKGYMDLLHTKGSLSRNPKSWLPGVVVNVGAYHYVVQHGMSTFINAIETTLRRKQVPILLNHKLTRITKDKGKYILSFQNEPDIEADYIIMTLPFSTLRDVKIDPSVDLKHETLEVIKLLPYGTNSKIGVSVAKPANITTDLLYYINLTSSCVAWPGEKALTIYVSAEEGSALTEGSAQGILDREMPHFKDAYPDLETSRNIMVKNWSTDPFSKGSYSAITTALPFYLLHPSQKHPQIYSFAEPAHDGHFIFAGEHTRFDGIGHIESAVRSGILAANILMETHKAKSHK